MGSMAFSCTLVYRRPMETRLKSCPFKAHFSQGRRPHANALGEPGGCGRRILRAFMRIVFVPAFAAALAPQSAIPTQNPDNDIASADDSASSQQLASTPANQPAYPRTPANFPVMIRRGIRSFHPRSPEARDWGHHHCGLE